MSTLGRSTEGTARGSPSKGATTPAYTLLMLRSLVAGLSGAQPRVGIADTFPSER